MEESPKGPKNRTGPQTHTHGLPLAGRPLDVPCTSGSARTGPVGLCHNCYTENENKKQTKINTDVLPDGPETT